MIPGTSANATDGNFSAEQLAMLADYGIDPNSSDEHSRRVVAEILDKQRETKEYFATPSESVTIHGKTLQVAKYVGDIVVTPDSKLWTTGHAMMFTEKNQIIEAPGKGMTVRYVQARKRSVSGGTKQMFTKSSVESSKRAADWARGEHGNGYTLNLFSGNKKMERTGETNCSRLVWASYKHQGIDLDSDGGHFVWPIDIAKSEHVSTYKTY